MWSFLWTSDLFYHKVAIFRGKDLWEIKVEEKEKMGRKDFYLAKVEKKNFLLLASGQRVFCSEEFPVGQEKIVQVLQEERGNKLAEVSQKLEITGRFFVYFPLETRLSMSKKIVEEEERKRLRDLVANFQEEGSFLIRTEAKGETKEVLEGELHFLLNTWKEIQKNAFQKRSKKKLCSNRFWIDDILQKYGMEEWDFCYVEDFEEFSYLEKRLLLYKKKGREYCGDVSLWQAKQMDRKIKYLCQARVDLEQGVYLFFERTQACVSIDVNSLAVKAKLANEIAAREIPKQLRLRNWSGIIVIDFIDGKEADKKNLLSILQEGFEREISEINWGGFQSFYLCIFTRQRKGKELESYFQRDDQKYQILLLENELADLLERGEKNFFIEGEKNLLQEWKKRSRCGIKDSIGLVESTMEKYYKIQIQK